MPPTTLETAADLESAFVTWNRLLFQYVFARLRQREVAEDLVQEVFFKAWRSRESFNAEKSSLKNWLFAITINAIRDYFRTKKPESEILTEDLASTQEVAREVGDKDLVRFVFKKVKKLPERDQELILLRYNQGLNVIEIADIVGMEYSATKVALHRAIKKLKTLCE